MRHPQFVFVLCALVIVPVQAQMDHSAHDMSQGMAASQPSATMSEMSHDMNGYATREAANASLPPLATVPASGKARESGMDGRHVQEATGAGVSGSERCALAARGIVMLDNASWAACGGKTQGIPQTPAALAAPPSHRHMMH